MASPDAQWERLGELLLQRRAQLDPRYGRRTRFTAERHLDYRIAYEVEKARRHNFGDGTLASIEAAYELAPGSIMRTVAGGPLEPRRDSDPAPDTLSGAGSLTAPPAVASGDAAVPDEREELRDLLAQAELEARVAELEDQIRAEIRAAERDGRDPFPGDELSAQVWAARRSEEYRIAALALIRMAARRQKNPVRRAG
jgi:hypothetical protein